MSQDKELEIKRQFLDEAEEYLQTLEEAVLGLSSSRIDAHKINGALRAAHSVKGGAGMMGYQLLNELSHRLEDSFKVLKVRKQSLEVDADLEHLLLAGVDCLRHVISCDRQTLPIEPEWLHTSAQPVFEQLYDRLGEPQAEDANSVLSPEDGQDILPLLFETEVEDCLQRLETALAAGNPDPLRTELAQLAQELGALGEMLQLEPFTQLCASVAGFAGAAPDVAAVAEEALKAWRRSQALVLTQQLDLLPRAIAIEGVVLPDLPAVSDSASDSLQNLPAHDEIIASQFDSLEHSEEDSDLFDSSDEPTVPLTVPAQPQTPKIRANEISVFAGQPATVEPEEAEPDTTVRVSTRHLNQLSDLFGELTIDRNALNLYLTRLRNLTKLLSHRVQVLEQSNSELRTAYDRLSVNSGRSPHSAKLLSASPSSPLQPYATFAPELAASSAAQGFDVLELDRYDSLHLLAQEVQETIVQVQEVTSDIDLSLEDVEQTARALNKTANQLQSRLTQVRMRPLSDIVDRFPRALRDLCLQHGKRVRLEMSGVNTLIDRNILEALNDPLMHLLRNAFDHGIEDPETRKAHGKLEEGTIQIQAFHRGSRTIITVKDDGNGIPIERIREKAIAIGLDPVLLSAASDEELVSLIFEPGFSTTDQVTALSGRGVGMDVVRDSLKQVRGDIKVSTQAGQGTTFTLSVPFTMSVVRVLLVESNGMLLAVPSDVVGEMLALDPENVIRTGGGDMLNVQGSIIPLVVLSRWLRFRGVRYPYRLETPPSISSPTVLLVEHNGQAVGVQIDACWGEQETAVRRVNGTIALPPGFSNCTILGDGRVVPLVNLSEMLHWVASAEAAIATPSHPPTEDVDFEVHQKGDRALSGSQPAILVIDDSINVRRFLALTLEKAGYQVEQAKDGQEAVEKLRAGLRVNAVVCDIEMPRLDGYGFLAKVKSDPQFEHLPVTMLTSRTSAKHRQLALSLGAIAYFSKPYNEQTLLATLAQHIHDPSQLATSAAL
jgi:chemotaxis family two-component system sensor histidine kinase/response regulator PixL